MNIFSESIKPKLSKIKDIILWAIYANVIDHKNICHCSLRLSKKLLPKLS